jgi:trimethylamine--corrinoid protein Co-methyltransferase
MIALRFLSQADLDSIHSATLEVLAKTGVVIKNEIALELLDDAGCIVEGRRVKIPSSFVEESIRKAPSSFNLYNRNRVC